MLLVSNKALLNHVSINKKKDKELTSLFLSDLQIKKKKTEKKFSSSWMLNQRLTKLIAQHTHTSV